MIPLGLMSVVMLFEVHRGADNSTQRVQDQMLLSTAFGISENALNTQGDLLLLEVIQQTSNETVFYKVEGPGGAFVVGYGGVPAPPPDIEPVHREPHFYVATYRGERVRVVALPTLVDDLELEGWMTVFVAQPTSHRESLVWDQVIGSSLRLGLLVVIAGLLAWVAVSLGLKPLARLERAIGRRSYDDLSPIRVQIPREVSNVEAALNGLLGRLESSIGRNKRFVANASHQLRTPVAELVAQTELVLRESGPGTARSAVEQINASALRMSRLIAQLLALARADGVDRARQEFEHFDVNALCRSVTARRAPRAIGEGIDLGFEGPAEEVPLRGVATLFEEALENLIDNACRYCPSGSVITVKLRPSNDALAIEVLDDGPGIPVEDRERMLERFARLNVEEGDGSGLGLAIAREVAELHGGRLRLLDGERGRGLCVRIEVPTDLEPILAGMQRGDLVQGAACVGE